ncbi:gamma-glutamyl-gamma-aminobutyrate hydrolase family protein [Rhodobium gokarnense]|uniref:Glutamine amidotransferase n=1 Tax=Rhodobium gokarnense TaxID=364296 RepID=A0ABT3HI96_9HYPH|nr:gamma-glutamyl-gamma-aminobutyrate hydrolase family protein [Rhodobium gokarnense]MCW2310136.1 putative glutamine amidotransferase [Rhodobium gokarnense]
MKPRKGKSMPCIGVTTSAGGGRYMWWFYFLSLRLYGVRPVRLIAPIDGIDITSFDGLIIGGGDNIGAGLYQGDLTLDVNIDPARDAMELRLLELAARCKVPVLGVCRGAQLLNVFRGGSLHQDLHKSFEDVPHMWTPLPRKYVTIEAGSKLADFLGRVRFKANSLHRQAIDRPGEGMEVSARDEYGIVQGIEDPKARFLIGVQWHPEFLIYRASQRRLFRAFLNAAEAYCAER